VRITDNGGVSHRKTVPAVAPRHFRISPHTGGKAFLIAKRQGRPLLALPRFGFIG
jgi:hypothetical protein